MRTPVLFSAALIIGWATPVSKATGFQASVTGSLSTTLTGEAVFGPVQDGRVAGSSFSLTLGAYGQKGAVVLSRVSSERPAVGTYSISEFVAGPEKDGELHAFISLGAPTDPIGVFHGVEGTVTITESTPTRLAGRYDVRATGFLAASPDRDAQITVRGGFVATPSQRASRYDGTMSGTENGHVTGPAEYGPAGRGAERVFSLTLGGTSGRAAVIFARVGKDMPAPGVYRVRPMEAAAGDDFSAQVITGAPSQPTGVYRVERGTLTITRSGDGELVGSFELTATGFATDRLDDETRPLSITGSFLALPSAPARAAQP